MMTLQTLITPEELEKEFQHKIKEAGNSRISKNSIFQLRRMFSKCSEILRILLEKAPS